MDHIYNVVPDSGIYASKDSQCKRLIYRRLYKNLIDSQSDPDKRSFAITTFEQELLERRSVVDHDDIKMLWRLPPYIVSSVTKPELKRLISILNRKKKLKTSLRSKIFPPCVDEIDFSTPTYFNLFGDCSLPKINRQSKICTFGSCFARNISQFLTHSGYNSSNIPLSDTINSSSSVAVLIDLLASSEPDSLLQIKEWYSSFCKHPSISISDHKVQEFIQFDLDNISDSRALLQESDTIILTLGNIVEYKRFNQDHGLSVLSTIPRFLSLFHQDSVVGSVANSSLMKKLGYSLELMNFDESLDSCSRLLQSIRLLNPSARIIVTLSPIPIDNLIGSNVQHTAISSDCISKSTLRVCIDSLSSRYDFSYFPSYEIVRWLSPMTPGPIWGKEDGCSRHITEDLLLSIYKYFLFCISPEHAA